MGESGPGPIEPGTNADQRPTEGIQPDAAELRVERLYEDYSGRVYQYCLSRLDSPQEAEDALQATYLNAWRSLSSGVEPISTRPWLFQIASNVCSSMLRTRLGGASEVLRSPETFDEIPTETRSSDDLLGLAGALASLPERQRQALLLRDWRGLSYDEIASEMNSSYQAVETLLFRARKSVAAGLRKPEPGPVPVPVRARALAPLAFLIPLKDGFAAFKSAFSTSVAPIKVSLGIALGAAAPLVAYGVLERGIESTHQAKTAAAATVQLETPLTYTVPTGVDEAVPDDDAVVSPERQGSPPGDVPSPSDTHGGESAGGSAAAHTFHPGGSHDPKPPPTQPSTDPPPFEEEPPPDKVTICHHTDSEKNPIVTITVDPAAVENHLKHGDELGACAG